jgi:transposase
MDAPKTYYRPADAAKMLGVHRSTIDRATKLWRDSGHREGLPHNRPSHKLVLISAADLSMWIEGQQ